MKGKKVLVVDEPGFAKVCRALLRQNGIVAEVPKETGVPVVSAADYDLVITSFPFGEAMVSGMGKSEVPVLVLADCLSHDLLERVRSVSHSCCMIKPLDFDKFHTVVQRMLGNDDFGGEV